MILDPQNLELVRLPQHSDKSLKPWSAADELLLNFEFEKDSKILILNDRFGALSCSLTNFKTTTYTHLKSQEKAIFHNWRLNKLSPHNHFFIHQFSKLKSKHNISLIRAPKSNDLLHLLVYQASQYLNTQGELHIGFMTKYFSTSMIAICERYFEEVIQTKAVKKARKIICKGLKKVEPLDIIKKIILLYINE